MDTRTKIVLPEIAWARAAGSNHIAYVGSFDVLTAARLRRIRELAQPGRLLIAVVTDLPDSLLPTRARAELAASLAIIDLVVTAPFPSPCTIDDTEADNALTAELIRYIHQRNRTDE